MWCVKHSTHSMEWILFPIYLATLQKTLCCGYSILAIIENQTAHTLITLNVWQSKVKHFDCSSHFEVHQVLWNGMTSLSWFAVFSPSYNASAAKWTEKEMKIFMMNNTKWISENSDKYGILCPQYFEWLIINTLP